MKNTLVIGLILCLSNIAVAIPGDGVCECESDGNTWHAFDSNFQEIQLDCAKSGDTILMEPGIYYGILYEPGYFGRPGFFALIYPQGKNIIYKKDPNSSGEVILSGLGYDVGRALFFPPCEIINGEGNDCQLIGLTICCSPLPDEHVNISSFSELNPPWVGIVCHYSSPLIKDCNLVGYDYAFQGTRMYYAGIDIVNPNGKLVIESCRIADFNGSGITLRGNETFEDVNVEINNCLLSGVHTEFCAISITGYPTRGTLQINNSTISNFGGGGISVAGIPDEVVDLDLEVNSCGIVGNTSPNGSGGGIAWSSNTMLVSECNLIGNAAFDMGGGIYSTGSMARIEDCNIIGNIAGNIGGGIYCGNGHTTIKNCRIENNIGGYTSGDPCYGGGGIWGSNFDANHCIIRGNKAAGDGGGIRTDDANLINCVINENQAGGDGGGAFIGNSYGNTLRLYNCTIRNNEANGLGGGAYFASGPINVTNCIFWGNADTEDTTGYQRHHQIYSSYPYSVNLRNCDIERTSTNALYVFDDNIIYDEYNPDSNIIGDNLGGNIHNNPNFVDDYHISFGSPCINAGDNSVVDWAYDIDGEDRILNAIVDIGADEYYLILADYNKDGIVNFLDFAIFANAWLTENPFISLDNDNDVDINDLKIFCDYWLTYTNNINF